MRLAIAFVAALIAAPALAAAPATDFTNIQPGPRAEGGYVLPNPYSDAILLKIDAFHGEGSQGSYQCAVQGEVVDVYRGLHYRKDETAVIKVPCGRAHVSRLELMTFGGFSVDVDWLSTVRYAIVQLDDKGRVVGFASDRSLVRVQ